MCGVNKLLEDKKMQYVKGSTALAPKRQEKEPDRQKDYESLRKSKIERENRLKHKKNMQKRRVLKTIVTIFIAGIGLMYNEGRIYEKQQRIIEINNDIKLVNQQIEDTKFQLLKLNSVANIKETADNELNMTIPKNTEAVYVDFSKNNFAEVPQEEKESFAEEVLGKIKSLLF